MRPGSVGAPVFAKFARFYDLMYGFKDYPAETARLLSVIVAYQRSDGHDLLDVACGTGAHATGLGHSFAVTGIDLDADLLALARERNPHMAFHPRPVPGSHAGLRIVGQP